MIRTENRPVRARSLRRVRRYWQLYLLVLPAIVSVFIFHYIPLYGVQIAFKNFKASRGIWGSEWIGLKMFTRFFTFAQFWQILWNTLRISLCCLLTFPLPVLFALTVNEARRPWFKRSVQMVTYAPHFVSTVVVCSMIVLFTDYQDGIVNRFLVALGGERHDFMIQAKYFTSLYVISDVWQNLGWSSIIYIAALAGISPELVEAAKIDGASRLQIVRHVNFPSILPTVIVMLILSTGRVLSVGFEKIFLMQNSLNLDTSRVISTYVYEIGLRGGQFNYSAAIGLFNNIVNIVFIVLVNTMSKKITSVGLW